jgi:hypothetical protein
VTTLWAQERIGIVTPASSYLSATFLLPHNLKFIHVILS